MMSPIHANLPHVPALNPASASADFRRTSGARTWHHHSHIQRDEVEQPSRNSVSSKTRLSASAMVLARKRKRKLLNGKKMSPSSDKSDYNVGDSERDSLNMEEQLTSFVEYNATDMDSLDINPSQDFYGSTNYKIGEEQDTATQASQCMQSCSWEDITDVNQIRDEASEVFDNVIYASPPALIPTATNTSVGYSAQKQSNFSSSSFVEKANGFLENEAVNGSPFYNSDGSLSDGVDIAFNHARNIEPTLKPSTLNTSGRHTSTIKPQWKHRRSVKRDCSLIDTYSNSFVNERLLLMPSVTSVATSEPSSDRVIELKDGCFDSSDDVQQVCGRRCEASNRIQPFPRETTTSFTVPSSPLMRFQPRLPRKRRKVSQLTLDGFYRLKKA